jgi:hypothetical protein
MTASVFHVTNLTPPGSGSDNPHVTNRVTPGSECNPTRRAILRDGFTRRGRFGGVRAQPLGHDVHDDADPHRELPGVAARGEAVQV